MRLAKILFLGDKKLAFPQQSGGGGGVAKAQQGHCLRKFRLQSKQYSQPPLQFPPVAQMTELKRLRGVLQD